MTADLLGEDLDLQTKGATAYDPETQKDAWEASDDLVPRVNLPFMERHRIFFRRLVTQALRDAERRGAEREREAIAAEVEAFGKSLGTNEIDIGACVGSPQQEFNRIANAIRYWGQVPTGEPASEAE